MGVTLVTGGNGFVGQHVKLALKRDCIEFVAPSSSKLNLLSLNSLLQYCTDYRITKIVHLAARCGGIGVNKDNPGKFMYENLMMGANVMEAARRQKIERVVNLGTVCSYPKHTPVPFLESELWNGYPEETNAPYGIAKKTVAELGRAYHEQYGLNVINLLPVNMAGEYDNFDLYSSHVIPALIRKFEEAKDGKVTLWGDGSASREFLYAGDCAKAIVYALTTSRTITPDPINLGTGREVTIKELVELTIEAGGYNNIEVTWDTSKPNGQPRRCLDTSKAAYELLWVAMTSTPEILRKTINWYREENNV